MNKKKEENKKVNCGPTLIRFDEERIFTLPGLQASELKTDNERIIGDQIKGNRNCQSSSKSSA